MSKTGELRCQEAKDLSDGALTAQTGKIDLWAMRVRHVVYQSAEILPTQPVQLAYHFCMIISAACLNECLL